MTEALPGLGHDDFAALRLGQILYGWRCDNMPREAIIAALDTHTELRVAAKEIRGTILAQEALNDARRAEQVERVKRELDAGALEIIEFNDDEEHGPK